MVKWATTILVALTLISTNSLGQLKDRIKVLSSDEIPVNVSILDVSRKYDSGLDEPVYSITYSIRNRSDSVVGDVAFIEYHINHAGEIRATSFWSERDPIRPNETKQFFTYSSFGDYENSTSIWNAHSVCMELGTMDLDFNGVEKTVKALLIGRTVPLPRAKGSLFPRCGVD